MKKFLLCVTVLMVGLSCTDNNKMCGCVAPVKHFSLVITNAQGADLLDPAVTGSYPISRIKVRYQEDKTARITEIQVKEPFTYGEGQKNKFPFYQLISSELTDLSTFKKPKEFTIDLGEQNTYSLTVDPISPDILKINGVALTTETSLPDSYGKVYRWVK